MYKIVRFYKDSNHQDHNKVIKTGLTEAEAQEHCQREDTHERGVGFNGHALYHYNSFVCVGVPYVGSGVSYIGSGRTANAYKHLHTQTAALGNAVFATGRCPGKFR